MAAIDTIEGYNLRHEHLNTSDIYSINAAGFAGEAVECRTMFIDSSGISAFRLIPNNNYGASGSTVLVKARLTGLKAASLAPSATPTKFADVEILPWTSISIGAAAALPSEIDLSLIKSCILHLFCAIVGTTAHLGTEFRAQVRNEAAVSDGWSDLSPGSIVMCSGKTAFKLDVKSTAAAGQGVIAVDNPTAGHLNYINKKIFILDATAANSEIFFQTAVGADS